jgi:hypothetical protein
LVKDLCRDEELQELKYEVCRVTLSGEGGGLASIARSLADGAARVSGDDRRRASKNRIIFVVLLETKCNDSRRRVTERGGEKFK